MNEIVRAQHVRSVMNNTGWRVVEDIAEQLVCRAEKDVIACEDENKVLGLQRKAQAAREFWNRLRNALQSATEIHTDDDAGLA